MTISVCGKIYLLNGQLASITMGARQANAPNGSSAQVSISTGIVKIDFHSGMENANLFELYHIAYDLLDNFVLSEEVRIDKGLIFFPETAERDGTRYTFEWPLATNVGAEIDQVSFINVLAANTQFRHGVRDFHTGLLDNKNCPTHFYRAIESFRLAVIETNDRKLDWEVYKYEIGITGEEDIILKELTDLANEYRHGNREGVIDYSKWITFTKKLLIKTYNCLRIII